ncbi:MAG: helix-turn-helix transcriptional regulator [Clostridia bacterium]|nr:helix-turn-helix transcriptional regulator [Clostridia bacterium]
MKFANIGKSKTLNGVVVDRLCKLMDEKNLTQYKLAQLSGIPFPTLKSIMQRRTKGITLKTIVLLCNGLGVTPSEFLDDPCFQSDDIDLE